MAKVMVVDDDVQLLRMIKIMIERGGHTAVLESEPRNTIELIRKERPDVLVVDVMMPHLSGHDLTQRIRAKDDLAELPILVLTARSQPIDRKVALDSGANDYMTKPIIGDELMDRISNLLMIPQKRQSPGVVISLLSFRGGVGRTTLATNLAGALRQKSGGEVCLLDLSPSGGQVKTHLRLQNKASWMDLPPAGTLTWSTLQENMLTHSSGVRLLAAPDLPQSPILPSGEATETILDHLKEHMSYIVIDLPTMFNPAAQKAISASDMVLHVVTPDVVTIKATLQGKRLLAETNLIPKQNAYVLNRVNANGHLSADLVEKGLKARLAFQIEYDSNQSRALAQGMPLSLSEAGGNSSLPTVMKRLAGVIWQHTA